MMTRGARKFALLTHVTFSVGWLGAVVAYLALATGGLVSRDVPVARAAYLSMELVGWAVIVPFSLATMLTGLVQALGTEWGLFRHYWVAVKFVFAAAASLVLLLHMRVVGKMSGVARETALSPGDYGGLRIQLVVHAVGGLLVLIAATVLSIYKPWGLTPYGRRKRREMTVPAVDSGPAPARARSWTFYAALTIAGVILLLLIAHHLAGGGLRHH